MGVAEVREMASGALANFCVSTAEQNRSKGRHQAWVRWVRDNDVDAQWNDWLEWVVERYEFAG